MKFYNIDVNSRERIFTMRGIRGIDLADFYKDSLEAFRDGVDVLCQRYQNTDTEFYLPKVQESYNYDGYNFVLIHYKLESDEEFAARIKRLEESRVLQYELDKNERRALYETLKREFDDAA